jgi:16S rRNA (uracil1498-N3)-methyltransferase
MHRFHVDSIPERESIIISDPGQLHHLRDVLRLATNEEITVFDGRGYECQCIVSQIDAKSVILTVKTREVVNTPKVRMTVACALPKKGLDDIVDKLTQLGVRTIIPMMTERVVVRMEGRGTQAKLNRWRRLAQAAAEQSQRGDIPEIKPLTEFREVVGHSDDFTIKLIPNLGGDRKNLNEIVTNAAFESILVLIGPEGDFTAEEVDMAVMAGFIPVSLGSLVLRVDTAAVAVAAYIRMATGTKPGNSVV